MVLSRNSRPAICVLMPYFGNWPAWFPLYLSTCGLNPSVTWLFLTDCPPVPEAPPNVRFVSFTMEDFRQLAHRKLGYSICLHTAFKVCDFRPAFGHLFSDYLKDFDFWGWGDTDVVYGKLFDVLRPEMFQNYDAISSRSGFLAGELSFMRNCESVNFLYQQSRDHKTVFTTEKNFNFCERGFFKNRSVDSISHVVERAHRERQVKRRFDDFGRTDLKLKRRRFEYCLTTDGLFDCELGEQILLYHFITRKKDPSYCDALRRVSSSPVVLLTEETALAKESEVRIRPKPYRIALNRVRRLARRLRLSLSR